MSESTWRPSSLLLDELLLSSQSAYNRYAPTVSGFSPFLIPSLGTRSYDESASDGFYGAAYQIGSDVIISFEGTWANSLTYAFGTLSADVDLFIGLIPEALAEAQQFAFTTIQAASAAGIQHVYVTGHSLGGAEAEWVAKVFGLSGASFGAPGIPGYSDGSVAVNFVNYVDYGDPVGNFASDSSAVQAGDWISPLTHADHVGAEEYVGSSADATTAQAAAAEAALAAVVGLASGNILDQASAVYQAGKAVSTAAGFHSLSNYMNLLYTDQGGPGYSNLPMTGSVTASWSQVLDSLGNAFWSFVGVTSSDITINAGNLFNLPAVAEPTGGLASWGSPGTWGASQFGFDAALTSYSILAGVLSSGSAIGAAATVFENLADFITNYGPSERTVGVPLDIPVYFPIIGSFSVSLTANANVGFNVTIAPQADVVMDQDNVVLNSLHVLFNGQLLAGSSHFLVRTNLTNDGELTVAGGVGGEVDGLLHNTGLLQVEAPLAAQGEVINSGTIQVLVASGFSLQGSVNYGTVEAELGGSVSIVSGLMNTGGTIAIGSGSSGSISGSLTGGNIDISGGSLSIGGGDVSDVTISLENSSTIYLNQLGTLDGVTLVSDGTGQLVGSASGYVAYWYGWQFQHASVLSDVTIGAGVTYTATTNNVTVLRGTIDNAGVLAAVPGSPYAGKYAIDGSVWLDGSGHVTLSSGQINPGANWGTSEVDISGVPDLFINVDNTLDGYG